MSTNASSTFNYLTLLYSNNINIAFNTIRAIFLLPFSIIILYLGFQKWRQQHSFRTASHSDLFAYHLAAMELIWVLGWFCILCSLYVNVAALATVGACLSLIPFYGEILFHILTCIDWYLAVIHPIIYMGLKNSRGIRTRNIIVGCVWVFCALLIIIHVVINNYNAIELFCLLAVSIIVTCYCSLSVLCVLIRPGPGDGAREQEQVDQSKQRAFNTIIATSAALWSWFVGLLVGVAVGGSPSVNLGVSFLVIVSTAFLNLPSCLVSPLLYLHRAGKLAFSCCSRE